MNALVVSRIDYCNVVLTGVHDVHLQQLQRVLNAAARLIVRKRKYDSISATTRDVLHWLPIRQRVDFKLSVLVFNCLNNLASSYLSTMCQPVANNAGRRHLCSAACGDLAVPATKTVRCGPVTSLLQDRPCGTLFQYCHVAATFHPHSVVIGKLNCSSERIISTLVTVCSCKSGEHN